jgi:hypothetical protein
MPVVYHYEQLAKQLRESIERSELVPYPLARAVADALDGAGRKLVRKADLTAALTEAAEHHEDQARAWGGSDEDECDPENRDYHAERAKVFRKALAAYRAT